MRSVRHGATASRSTLTGAATVDALVALYAHLERRTPVLLLHPRLTAHERGELDAAAARAGPLPHPDAAAIIYTSGTTGMPRAAVLTRDALEASAAASAANLGWEADDRWLLCMPIAHVGGLSIVTRCLIARRCVVLTPKFDAAAVAVGDRRPACDARIARADDARARARRASRVARPPASSRDPGRRRRRFRPPFCGAPWSGAFRCCRPTGSPRAARRSSQCLTPRGATPRSTGQACRCPACRCESSTAGSRSADRC